MKKHLAILGSTGSIGVQTLDVVRAHDDLFHIAGLSVHSNIELLKKQIDEFEPEAVAVMDEQKAEELKSQVSIPVYSGIDGISKIATLMSADVVVNALVGSVGVQPTYDAITHKKDIALANKETLVAAGEIIMKHAAKNKVPIIPIDSEHSAILQCIGTNDKKSISKLIVTASGGPFRNKTKEELQSVTKKDALAHPTWNMGDKITIDSSTLINKGFEVIEAHHLFGVSYDHIEVLVHPQSTIHSMVEFCDGSVLAQLDKPDMRLPIQYALTYPKREDRESQSLDLSKLGQLTFEKPDVDTFPALKMAFDLGKKGGSLPCVLNAANEVAVQAFLEEKISYVQIVEIIQKMVDSHEPVENPNVQTILAIDTEVKQKTKEYIDSL